MRCEYATYQERDNLHRVLVEYAPCTAEIELGVEDITDEDWEQLQASPFRAFKLPTSGRAVKLSDLLSRRTRRELPSFADSGMLDELFAFLTPPGSTAVFVHVHSSHEFTERDRSVFQLVLPHLAARRRNAQARRRLATALDALARDEGDVVGVIRLNQDGAVTFASSAASRLLRRPLRLIGRAATGRDRALARERASDASRRTAPKHPTGHRICRRRLGVTAHRTAAVRARADATRARRDALCRSRPLECRDRPRALDSARHRAQASRTRLRQARRPDADCSACEAAADGSERRRGRGALTQA